MSITPEGWYSDRQRKAVTCSRNGTGWLTHLTNALTLPPPPKFPWGWRQRSTVAGAVVVITGCPFGLGGVAFGIYVRYGDITGPDAEDWAEIEPSEAVEAAAVEAASCVRSADVAAQSSAEITCEKLVTLTPEPEDGSGGRLRECDHVQGRGRGLDYHGIRQCGENLRHERAHNVPFITRNGTTTIDGI